MEAPGPHNKGAKPGVQNVDTPGFAIPLEPYEVAKPRLVNSTGFRFWGFYGELP